MKAFKIIATLLLLGLIYLFISQNMHTFRTTMPFSMDLFLTEEVKWAHELSTLMLISGLIGFLLGLFVMFRPYLKLRRSIHQSQQNKEEKPARRSLIGRKKTAHDKAAKEPTKKEQEKPAAAGDATSEKA